MMKGYKQNFIWRVTLAILANTIYPGCISASVNDKVFGTQTLSTAGWQFETSAKQKFKIIQNCFAHVVRHS